MRADVGFTQLVTRSPVRFGVTRPEAIPPRAVPRKNGVRIEETANRVPKARRPLDATVALRNAKPAPRRTIPRAARLSGTYSVDAIAAKATGKPDHSTTRQKIN